MGASPALFTIGYEGATLDTLIAALAQAGVRTLVDVRDRPYSRKPGFSKPSLSAAMERAGVRYVHLGALGTPAEGRDAARAGRHDVFKRIMKTRLDAAEGQGGLAQAATLAKSQGPICLLCLERDPADCHRSLVADRLKRRTRLPVRHLAIGKSLSAA